MSDFSESTGSTEPPETPSSATPQLPPNDSAITWGSLAHLGGVAGVIPAIAIWLVAGNRSRFIEVNAREAINFQLTGLVAWVALFALNLLAVTAWKDFAVFVAPVLYFALWAAIASFSILGFLAARQGRTYRYTFAIRLFSVPPLPARD